MYENFQLTLYLPVKILATPSVRLNNYFKDVLNVFKIKLWYTNVVHGNNSTVFFAGVGELFAWSDCFIHMVGEAVSWFVPWNQSVYQKVREVGVGKLCVTITVTGMESVILETLRKVVTELPREDAEVKAVQLSKDLTERGLLTSQELKFVTKDHLLPMFNEFQALRILHEWNKPQTGMFCGIELTELTIRT